MLKIERFYPNRQKMEVAFNQKVRDRLEDSFGNCFGNPYKSSFGMAGSIPSFDYIALVKETSKDPALQETWINPDCIAKIDVLKNKMTDETYLKLTMKSGESYDVVGDSVQSFFLKNIVLGNDVTPA